LHHPVLEHGLMQGGLMLRRRPILAIADKLAERWPMPILPTRMLNSDAIVTGRHPA
jgi:hypothetical protein